MEADLLRKSSLRERQKVLFVCAAIIPLFAFADRLALGHFSPLTLGTRAVWTAGMLLVAGWLPRTTPRQERALQLATGVATSGFFAALVLMTGGDESPLFHWILAMPLVVAVVLQDHPGAVVASAVTMVASGVGILLFRGNPASLCVQWAVQAAGMSTLAWYASMTYRRLRQRERTLEAERRAAIENANAYAEQVMARDEFLSIASHELRTPLTSLELHVQSLRNSTEAGPQPPSGRELHDRVTAIDRQAQRLNRLIQDLLDLTRLRTQSLSLQLGECDLVERARTAAARLHLDAQRARAPIAIHADAPVLGHWDAQRIDQVLTNLLSNALKYGAGQPVTVTVSRQGSVARVVVEDHGIGIDPRDHQRIFARFTRAVSSRHYGGLGLGLWIAKEIVTEHHGSITVESALDLGSRFIVELPLDARVPTGGPALPDLSKMPRA